MREWREKREALGRKGECFMVDLEQRPGTKGCTAGPEWPTQLTHGIMCALGDDEDDWKIMTGTEHFLAHGLTFHQTWLSTDSVDQFMRITLNLKTHHKKQLLGNGMHLLTQACWMLYVLANTIEVDQPKPQMLMATSCPTNDEAEEEEEEEEAEVSGWF